MTIFYGSIITIKVSLNTKLQPLIMVLTELLVRVNTYPLNKLSLYIGCNFVGKVTIIAPAYLHFQPLFYNII